MNGTQGIVVGLVAGAAIGGVAGFLAAGARPTPVLSSEGATPGSTTATGPASTAAPAPATAPAAATVTADPAALAAAQTKLATAEARVAALEGEKAALAAEVAKLRDAEAAPAGATAAAATTATFRFGVSGKSPVFDKADWKKLAGHMASLEKHLPGLMADIGAGRQPSPAAMTAIQRDNMPLAAFAIQAADELGGTGANGSFTHPAVIANLLRGILANAGDPLTEAQEATIRALGDAWLTESQRADAAYTAATPALQKTIDEVDQKQAFLRAVRGLLSPTQQAQLFHPATEGRIGMDLLSPGLIYQMRNPVMAHDRATLERKCLEALLQAAGIEDAAAAERYAAIGRSWLDALPAALQPVDPKGLEVIAPHVDAVQAAARAHLAAIERLLALAELTPDQAGALRQTTIPVTPTLTAHPAPSGH